MVLHGGLVLEVRGELLHSEGKMILKALKTVFRGVVFIVWVAELKPMRLIHTSRLVSSESNRGVPIDVVTR